MYTHNLVIMYTHIYISYMHMISPTIFVCKYCFFSQIRQAHVIPERVDIQMVDLPVLVLYTVYLSLVMKVSLFSFLAKIGL